MDINLLQEKFLYVVLLLGLLLGGSVRQRLASQLVANKVKESNSL